MGVSTSTGQYHDDMFSYYASKVLPQPITDTSEGNKRTSDAPKGSETPSTVDQEHHVPMLASAIMDDTGGYAGLAIDHRVNIPTQYHQYLALHEKTELDHMQNLIKGGMHPHDAYEEAHDRIATPIESAKVRADLGEEGLEKYKQTMRDAASIAAIPSDREKHPDAHTTKFKLDELLKKGKEQLKEEFEKKKNKDYKAPGHHQDPRDIKLAGDVVQFPGDPMEALQRMRTAQEHPEFVQRGLIFNEQTQQWEDLKAKIIPLTPRK